MAEILGTQGNDDGADNPALIGSAVDDTIAGFAGNDRLEGLGGDDFLSPGPGLDTVLGGDGDDTVLLAAPIFSGTVLDGGDGRDRLLLNAPGQISIDPATVTGFEVLDLNRGSIRLSPDQFTQFDTILRNGAITLSEPGTLLLGSVDRQGVDVRISGHFEGASRLDAAGSALGWNLTGGAGDGDTLIGGAGNDTLRGQGRDSLSGGEGDDTLVFARRFSEPVGMQLDGGPGRDTLIGGTFDTVDMTRSGITDVEVLRVGGALTGAQLRSFDSFEDIIQIRQATPGTVDLTGKSVTAGLQWNGRNVMIWRASPNDDRLILSDMTDNAILEMDNGNDWVLAGSGNDELLGDRGGYSGGIPGNDTLNGGDGFDTLDGDDGDDQLIGGDSPDDVSDLIFGGNGSDLIFGGAGNDRLYGEGGFFDIRPGDDTVHGGEGSDTIFGGAGDDSLIGGDTETDVIDLINGQDGNDWIDGGYGNDSLLGGEGHDTILGGVGSDTLMGHAGDDLITGGPGSDLIFGGPGDDFINGGFGSDRINGGAGADRFFHALDPGHGSDWIQDFAAEDALVAPNGSSAADFQVNRANTPGAGAADVDEAFVIYRPTGQILWALVDGAALPAITLRIDEVPYDLLA